LGVLLFPFVASIFYFFFLWIGVIPVLPSSPTPSSPRYVILVHYPSDAFDVSFRLEGPIWSRSPFVWLCYVTVWVFKAPVTLTCCV